MIEAILLFRVGFYREASLYFRASYEEDRDIVALAYMTYSLWKLQDPDAVKWMSLALKRAKAAPSMRYLIRPLRKLKWDDLQQ